MKIEIQNGLDWNKQARIRIGVNGKDIVNIGCLSECPEDASLERDLGFVYRIVPSLKEAYEAGKRGEELLVVESLDKE